MKTQVSKTQVSKKKKKQVKAITPAGISKKIHQSTKKPSQTIHYTDVKKIPQTTIPEDKRSNHHNEDMRLHPSVNKYFMLREQPLSKAKIKDVRDDLLYWLETEPEIFTFNAFLQRWKIYPQMFESMVKREPSLAEAKKYAFSVIAERRETRALKANPDGSAFRMMQGFYDSDWKTQEQYHNDLKTQSNDGKTKIIVLPKIEAKDPEDKDGTERRTTYYNE